VAATMLNFIVNRVSAIYVHHVKDRLYCGDNKENAFIKFTLSKCYEVVCKGLWPIVPFLVEESWKYYGESLILHKLLKLF